MTQQQIKIAVVVGFALACIIGFALWRRHERRRREGLARLASDMGLAFTETDDDTLQRLRGRLPLFDRGRRRRIRNAMAGAIEDLRVHVFDFQYTTGGGRSSTIWRQTVVGFDLPDQRLPVFALTPERSFHKVAELFGRADIDFTDHPLFSKRYRLTGADEAAIRAAFSVELIQQLEGADGLSVESDGGWLLVYRHARRVKADRIPGLLDQAFEICNLLA